MTTSEQAALLAKHRQHVHSNGLYKFCRWCDSTAEMEWCESCSNAPFPCDVHRMAELKDAEIAELRAEIERLREQIAMDDFAKNTTPGGTWIEGDDDA